jgi:2-keto-4-pentenoate hydratase/2-oxohepta-3-ene-1,7-dioic acid hydratase in catechol pathway
MGPLLTPAEFVDDPQDLIVELTVNGSVKQRSSTSQMIFSVADIVEHVASIMTLEPGDVISTGSPAGVGYARKPRERLQPGDRMALRIARLGPSLVTHLVVGES